MERRFSLLPGTILIGAAAAQSITVVGLLYVGEVLAPLMLLSLLGQVRLSRSEKLLVGFGILWSFAQLVSDQMNHTPAADSAKGVLAPLLFVSTIIGLRAYFSLRINRIPSFMLGAALGLLVGALITPSANPYFVGNPWKWGAGTTVLAAGLIYYSFWRRRTGHLWLLVSGIAFVGASLYFSARSVALLTLVALALYAARLGRQAERLMGSFRGKWGPARLIPAVLLVIILFNAGVSAISTSAVVAATVSPEAAAKYQSQSSGAFGVLLGGRSESLVSIEAFLDKPLLGHGSWARDDGGYSWIYSQNARRYGYVGVGSEGHRRFDLIPTHSFLMSALVWSGFMGGVFWIALLLVVIYTFLEAWQRLPLYFYVGVTFLMWDIAFSPFGALARWSSAAFLAALLAYVRDSGIE